MTAWSCRDVIKESKNVIPFIDIASYQQGPAGIDWPTLAAFLLNLHPEAGVIVKATEGTTYTNPFFSPAADGCPRGRDQKLSVCTSSGDPRSAAARP